MTRAEAIWHAMRRAIARGDRDMIELHAERLKAALGSK